MPPTFVIVGASLAGATAAATLRQDGFDGEVVLVGAEPQLPYERPPLSKEYLRGEVPFEKALVRPADYYDQNRIRKLLGVRATRVNPAERSVELDTRPPLRYDKLLIATGSRNRRPPIPGLDLPGVFDLRSVSDADALRGEIVAGRRAVLIGMGFIGCELAASLRQRGVEVVGIDPQPTPLFQVLGEEAGRAIGDLHREHGVRTVLGDAVARLEGDGRVRGIVTKGGRHIDCDFVVVGVGVQAVTDLVEGSGIETADGILVDEQCRTTVEGVYAAGDVANHYHPLLQRRMRVEHWQNAMLQGAAAARSMLGKGVPYEPLHWFWSDQYDLNLQYAGFHREAQQIVVRGSLDERRALVFYLNSGRIDAILALNRGKDLRRAMPLIKARVAADPARLADEAVDLRSMAAAAQPSAAGSE